MAWYHLLVANVLEAVGQDERAMDWRARDSNPDADNPKYDTRTLEYDRDNNARLSNGKYEERLRQRQGGTSEPDGAALPLRGEAAVSPVVPADKQTSIESVTDATNDEASKLAQAGKGLEQKYLDLAEAKFGDGFPRDRAEKFLVAKVNGLAESQIHGRDSSDNEAYSYYENRHNELERIVRNAEQGYFPVEQERTRAEAKQATKVSGMSFKDAGPAGTAVVASNGVDTAVALRGNVIEV